MIAGVFLLKQYVLLFYCSSFMRLHHHHHRTRESHIDAYEIPEIVLKFRGELGRAIIKILQRLI